MNRPINNQNYVSNDVSVSPVGEFSPPSVGGYDVPLSELSFDNSLNTPSGNQGSHYTFGSNLLGFRSARECWSKDKR